MNKQIETAIALIDMLKLLGFEDGSFYPVADEKSFGLKIKRFGKEGVIVIGPRNPSADYQSLMLEARNHWNSLSNSDREILFKGSDAYARKVEILATLVTNGLYHGKQS